MKQQVCNTNVVRFLEELKQRLGCRLRCDVLHLGRRWRGFSRSAVRRALDSIITRCATLSLRCVTTDARARHLPAIITHDWHRGRRVRCNGLRPDSAIIDTAAAANTRHLSISQRGRRVVFGA